MKVSEHQLRRIENLLGSAERGCPICRQIRIAEARYNPDGGLAQLDGSPLPPLCACGWRPGQPPKRIIAVLPDD